MSRFLHLAKKVTKTAATLYSGNSAATLTLTGTWPANGSKLKIVASSVTDHTDCAGSVTVGSEVITFSAGLTPPITKTTTNSLTALPTITTSGLDCYLTITVLDSGLAPIYTSVETDLPCTIKLVSRGVQAANGTWTSVKSTELRARGTFAIGDIIKFDITNFFSPTNGIERPILAWRPDKGLMGRENIKILEF